MGVLSQALSQIREEKKYFIIEKNATKGESSRKEEEKEKLGRPVVKMTLL